MEISCLYVESESGPKRVVLVDKKEKKIICLCDESVFGIESVPEVLHLSISTRFLKYLV